MGTRDDKACAAFEAALRSIGGSRLRLDQVVKAFQLAFPAATMQPDMRQQLRDAILDLSQSGVLTLSDEMHDDNQVVALPMSVEMSANVHWHDPVTDFLN